MSKSGINGWSLPYTCPRESCGEVFGIDFEDYVSMMQHMETHITSQTVVRQRKKGLLYGEK